MTTTEHQTTIQQVSIRIWDLPTRLFHWSLLVCIVGSFTCVKAASKYGPALMQWHFYFGYAVLTLLLFRLVWGVLGNRYARFGSFLPNPLAAWRTLRGAPAPHPGHNPLGAGSVYALLFCLLAQSVSGLFSNDDIANEGPFVVKISKDLSDTITGWHKLNEKIIIGLVLLHLAAITYYRYVKKERLVKAMVTGDKQGAVGFAAQDNAALRWRALAVFAACALLVWASVR